MKVRYQVFISSTFADLHEERLALSKAFLDLGHIPSGMELFPAADTEQLTYIKKVIDECDFYVLIIGGRYGSTDAEGISYTEREYDYAVESGKTVLAFLHGDRENIVVKDTDRDPEKETRLKDFCDRVAAGRLVRFWKNSAELVANAIVSLTHAISEYPQPGWVRANTVPSEATLGELIALREQNAALKKRLSQKDESIPDKFDDAAGLNAETILRYSYKYRNVHGSHVGEIKLTFGYIFQRLASKFHTPATSAMAALSIRQIIEEQDPTKSDVSIDQRDYERVLIQFRALGLLSMRVAAGTDGRTYTFFQLTPEGERAWIEGTYSKA